MKSNIGEIEEENLEDLNFWRLSKNSNLQITPISKPEPSEEDLKSASFAENGYTPNSLLDISQDKRLIAMGNTKGFSILSTTQLYSKLRQADSKITQAYPSIWVHTKRGIPSHIKFLPDGERILVVVRSYIQIYKISDIFQNNHRTSPIKEVDFMCESITKLAINSSIQNTRILVVFDGESIQLLDSNLNYLLYEDLKGTAVGFIEGEEEIFCIGHEDGTIKKYKINGNEVFTFPLPIDIQTLKVQLVEFQFVSSKYMVSLHYAAEEDSYWFTFSVIKDDEITYFSSENIVWPPTEGSALHQQFYISEIPRILPDNSQLFVLNFSCYDSSKFLKIDTSDDIKVIDIAPNERFSISHPVIEFNGDAESYPIGQVLDLSVQGRIPNPGEDSDKDFSPRPILTVLNTYGQCYSYEVIYEPNLKDENYTYDMAESTDYFVESSNQELSSIKWGLEIPEDGFPEALELSTPTTPVTAINELELEEPEQKLADNTNEKTRQSDAPKLTSQLTKESDYSLVSSSDDIADLTQVLDSNAETSNIEKKHASIASIKEEVHTEPTEKFQGKSKDESNATERWSASIGSTKEKVPAECKSDIQPTKKEIPKVAPTFKASKPLEVPKNENLPAEQDDSDEAEEEDEIEPVKLQFEWPKLPTYPDRPESPKLKETKEQVTSMIINLFKDKFNDKLKSTRTSLNNSGEQIMNFRDESLSNPVSIGENKVLDVTQWKQCLNQLIEAVKLKKANSAEWVNQVTDAYNGWKQLNSFNQHVKDIKDDGKNTRVQLHKLTSAQIREYSKMSDWNRSCNHLVSQLEELFAKIDDTRSDYEKVPTLDQINTIMNSIESSIQTIKNNFTSQLVQIENLQAEIIQSNNRYLPHYFVPNQTSASSSKESNLDSIQISEAGKKLAQQRKSKLDFNSQLLEVMRKHKPQWRKPMIKHPTIQPSISKQIPGQLLSHTFGSDELKDELYASTHSLHRSSGSQSVSAESI